MAATIGHRNSAGREDRHSWSCHGAYGNEPGVTVRHLAGAIAVTSPAVGPQLNEFQVTTCKTHPCCDDRGPGSGRAYAVSARFDARFVTASRTGSAALPDRFALFGEGCRTFAGVLAVGKAGDQIVLAAKAAGSSRPWLARSTFLAAASASGAF